MGRAKKIRLFGSRIHEFQIGQFSRAFILSLSASYTSRYETTLATPRFIHL